MKTITIGTHTVKGLDGGEFGTIWFVRWLINNDREFNIDGQGIRSSMRIEKACDAAELEHAEDLKLEDQDHPRLVRAAENPSTGAYPCTPARAALPWIEAIVEAK